MNQAILESVHIKIEEAPEDAILQGIQNPLRTYNEAKIGSYSAKKFALLAHHNEENRTYAKRRGQGAPTQDSTSGATPPAPLCVSPELIGGMFGWLQWGWLFIDWAWVDESCRRKKVGAALLLKFEEIAREHGISRARLNTASFQERLSFYKSHNYRIFAEIEITTPEGEEYIDYFLRKDAL